MTIRNSLTNGHLKGKRALVYNRYLRTVGGGERSTIDFGKALEDLGCSVTLISIKPVGISLEEILDLFGAKTSTKWELVEVEEEGDVFKFCKEKNFDVFLNHTFCSALPNPAPFGIYCVMFPQENSFAISEALKTYKVVNFISPFTELYGEIFLGTDLPFLVNPPPISSGHIECSNASFEDKERLVINIGRFNIDGHCKCQLEAVEAFVDLQGRGIVDQTWKMIVAGHLNHGRKNEAYFDLCKEKASKNVEVRSNLSFTELSDLYRRAAVLWQFTGVTQPKGVMPQLCEHLGLVAMDALQYGAIPVVYERSGVGYLLKFGETGFMFSNTNELTGIMSLINNQFGCEYHRRLFEACQREANQFSYPSFVKSLSDVIELRS